MVTAQNEAIWSIKPVPVWCNNNPAHPTSLPSPHSLMNNFLSVTYAAPRPQPLTVWTYNRAMERYNMESGHLAYRVPSDHQPLIYCNHYVNPIFILPILVCFANHLHSMSPSPQPEDHYEFRVMEGLRMSLSTSWLCSICLHLEHCLIWEILVSMPSLHIWYATIR